MTGAKFVDIDDSAETLSAADVGLSRTSLRHARSIGTRSHFVSRGRARVREVPVHPVHARRWAGSYVFSLLALDMVTGIVAASVAYFIRVPDTNADSMPIGPLAMLFPVLWVGTTWLMNCFDRRVVGLGPEEFQRCGRAAVAMLAGVGFASYALHAALPRRLVVVAVPLVAVLSLVGRYAMRKVLHRARAAGRASSSVVLVGDADSAVELAVRMRDEAHAGLRVVGACVPVNEIADPRARNDLAQAGVPLLGTTEDVLQAVAAADADTVAVTSSHALGLRRLRELSWQMESIDADMLVAPGLVEVAGPRLHIRPVTGLPLLHVEKPEFTGGKRALKNVTDRVAASLLLLLLSPLLLGIWMAIRLTSPGSGFFRQVRVGKDGMQFRIWKFRSMYSDAEARLAALEAQSDGNGVLFKMKSDPRITRVGGFIRRFSLDELPQLFNVLTGSMSLVGPRPPLPSEVAKYENHVRRRLLVRPGITGLWQVSGRSDLTWEESVRLDLRYVENWSLGQDAQIMWKTLSAVFTRSGAY